MKKKNSSMQPSALGRRLHESKKEKNSRVLSAPKVLILGVGNILLTDDGFGVHFVNELENAEFPENVRAVEAGTLSHSMIPEFHAVDHLIVIDTVDAGDIPGAIFKFSPDDLSFRTEQKLSLHQINLIDVLHMTALTGRKPETTVIGVQPKDVSSWSLEMSAEVKAVMPRVKELLFEELRKIQAMP